MQQSHQMFATYLGQHSSAGKDRVREVTFCEFVKGVLRNGDLKMIFNPEQQIEHIHRSESQIVEEKLLNLDWLISGQAERCANCAGHGFENSLVTHSTLIG